MLTRENSLAAWQQSKTLKLPFSNVSGTAGVADAVRFVLRVNTSTVRVLLVTTRPSGPSGVVVVPPIISEQSVQAPLARAGP